MHLRADPRARGGDGCHGPGAELVVGRSPRSRGRLELIPTVRFDIGPIPALAGETSTSLGRRCRRRADPRARGGDRSSSTEGWMQTGRSPRSRGRLLSQVLSSSCHGPIPALAGETRNQNRRLGDRKADPRARGGDVLGTFESYAIGGRSPRSRGRLGSAALDLTGSRPIPALAGETEAIMSTKAKHGADPRARGGDVRAEADLGLDLGRSPRSRGRLDGEDLLGTLQGPIPALAGETSSSPWWRPRPRADPRARGGDSTAMSPTFFEAGRSPRSRGRHVVGAVLRVRAGPIPALAGETRRWRPWARRGCRARADPRARGGDIRRHFRASRGGGRSPRSRGRRRDLRPSAVVAGPIPALAGETLVPLGPCRLPRADPRARGGDLGTPTPDSELKGRSPRSRGRPCDILSQERRGRAHWLRPMNCQRSDSICL